MKKIKAVLFDLDGVLVDSLDAWYAVFNSTLRSFGLRTLTRKEFASDFGAPIEHDMRKYFKGKTIEEVKDIYHKHFKKVIKFVKLNNQSANTLKRLKQQKIKLGLITNSSRPITLSLLKRFALNKYFGAVVTMEDVKRRKPAPDMALKACKLLKVSPKNTILVGDTKNDMIAGKRAGCITVGYKIKGDYRVNSLKEIESFICV